MWPRLRPKRGSKGRLQPKFPPHRRAPDLRIDLHGVFEIIAEGGFVAQAEGGAGQPKCLLPQAPGASAPRPAPFVDEGEGAVLNVPADAAVPAWLQGGGPLEDAVLAAAAEAKIPQAALDRIVGGYLAGASAAMEGEMQALRAQSGSDEAHARRLGDRITLAAKADPTSFMHEFGHVGLDLLRRLGTDAATPEPLRRDWETVRDWLGATEGAAPSRDQHERWAGGF